MMTVCPRCGTPGISRERFCRKCGEKLQTVNPQPNDPQGAEWMQYPQHSASQQDGEQQSPRRNRRRQAVRQDEGQMPAAPKPPRIPEPENREPVNQGKPPKGPWKWIIGCLALVFAAAIVLFVYPGWLNGKQDGKDEALSGSGKEADGETASGEIILYHSDPDQVTADPETGIRYVSNEILVIANPGTSEEEVAAFVSGIGGQVVGRNPYLGEYQILLSAGVPSLADMETVQRKMMESGLFADAFVNYVAKISPMAKKMHPNDSEWRDWDSYNQLHWGHDAIRVPEMWYVWDNVSRSQIRVGVIDNQFYTSHEDLRFAETYENRYMTNANMATHGTEVSGIIAASFNNGKGIAGILPNAELYGLSYNGILTNNELTVASLKAALTWLIRQKECKVVNLSFGLDIIDAENFPDKEKMEYIRRYVQEYNKELETTLNTFLDKGYEFLLVKSAGNSRQDENCYTTDAELDMFSGISAPRIKERIIVVGAAEDFWAGYRVVSFSDGGSRVDVIAPGVQIYTTEDVGYDYVSGTSFAAPYVTGTAAAVWSTNPELTGADVRKILVETATGAYTYEDSDSERFAMIDAYAAIVRAAGKPEEPEEEPSEEPAEEQDEEISYVSEGSYREYGIPVNIYCNQVIYRAGEPVKVCVDILGGTPPFRMDWYINAYSGRFDGENPLEAYRETYPELRDPMSKVTDDRHVEFTFTPPADCGKLYVALYIEDAKGQDSDNMSPNDTADTVVLYSAEEWRSEFPGVDIPEQDHIPFIAETVTDRVEVKNWPADSAQTDATFSDPASRVEVFGSEYDEEGRKWYRVRLNFRRTGYIRSDLLRMAEPDTGQTGMMYLNEGRYSIRWIPIDIYCDKYVYRANEPITLSADILGGTPPFQVSWYIGESILRSVTPLDEYLSAHRDYPTGGSETTDSRHVQFVYTPPVDSEAFGFFMTVKDANGISSYRRIEGGDRPPDIWVYPANEAGESFIDASNKLAGRIPFMMKTARDNVVIRDWWGNETTIPQHDTPVKVVGLKKAYNNEWQYIVRYSFDAYGPLSPDLISEEEK